MARVRRGFRKKKEAEAETGEETRKISAIGEEFLEERLEGAG